MENKIKHRTEEEKKKITVRINKIMGQMNGVKKMVDEDKYCNDILIQLLAIEKSIKSLSDTILENHLKTCVVNDIKNDNTDIVNEVVDLFKRYR